jgi:peroxiredoxin
MIKRALLVVPFLAAVLVLGPGCSSNPTGPDGVINLGGRIALGANPFEGVDIYLSWDTSRKTVTGADGKFSFDGLPAGDYMITPTKPGYAFNPSNFVVGTSTRTNLNSAASPAAYGTALGTIATDFTAVDQNGVPVTLSSFHGKVVLLDFTADWCTVCREKAQTAEAFYQQYKARGFMYVLVVIEGSAPVWSQTYGLTFPVLDDNSKAVYGQYQMTPNTLPLPHVLDRNMTIRYKKEGWNKAEVEDMIRRLL